jgi:hypothetical protein
VEELEGMDEFERELAQALEPMPAPPGLKHRLLQRREAQYAMQRRQRVVLWQRLAMAAVLLCAVTGALMWRRAEQRREGEEARRQVMVALRITTRALNQMELQLAAHNQSVLTHTQKGTENGQGNEPE